MRKEGRKRKNNGRNDKQNARKTHPLNRIPLLLRDPDIPTRTRRHRQPVTLHPLSNQLQELLRILANQLRELRVRGAHLLQHVFEHAGILLDQLAELLEHRVVAEEVEIACSSAAPSACC